jgi:hypothetical protein
MLLIDQIRRDGGTQIRVEFDETTADEFAELLMDGHEFPPVTVFWDGADYWLADGFHRMRAHERAWRLEIAADVRQGSRRDAILYAVGANAAHGIRRSDRDKRNAVETLLKDEEWLAKGFRWIGRQAAVSEGLVRRVYADLSAYRTQIAKPAVRTVERGGAVFPMDTANIGARPAAADPVQQPEWRQTDIEEIAPGAPAQAPEPLKFPPNHLQHRLAGGEISAALESIAKQIRQATPAEVVAALGGELWSDAADAEAIIPWLTEFVRLVPDEMSRRERSQPYLAKYRHRVAGK